MITHLGRIRVPSPDVASSASFMALVTPGGVAMKADSRERTEQTRDAGWTTSILPVGTQTQAPHTVGYPHSRHINALTSSPNSSNFHDVPWVSGTIPKCSLTCMGSFIFYHPPLEG